MCSAPKAPKMPKPQPLPKPEPLPPIEIPALPEDTRTVAEKRVDSAQMAQPQQRMAMVTPVTPPAVEFTPAPPTPATPVVNDQLKMTPPPQLANSDEDAGIVKRRKSKRKELQQSSRGTDALRIKLDRSKSIGSPKKGTGSSGLNIPN